MTKDDLGANSADDRRARAEKRLAATGVDLQNMPLGDVQNLVCELQVYQVELEMQNEELRRAQEEIQAARTKYADLYEFAPVGYFTFDRRGLILEANLTGARLLGMERHRIIGTPFFLQVAPEDRQLLHAHLQKVFASRVNQSCELKLTPREGVAIHLALESIAVYDHEEDNPQCRSAVTDITAEQPLKQEIARLASFPQLNPNPILEIDLSGAITFYNEAAVKKIRNLGLEDLRSLLPGDLDETLAAVKQKGEKSFCLEIKKADVVFLVHAHYTPQCQSIRLYYTNVTERKRAEKALKENERRMRAIFEQAAVGVAEIETATGRFLRVNKKYCEIVGLPREEMTATNFMAITLPEDLEVDLQYVQKLRDGQIRHFSREKRYLRPDGSVVWVNLTVSPMWEAGEEHSYHIAMVEDITTRKAAEAERDRFFNLSIDMLCIAGFDGYFKQLNPAWSKTLGWTEAELLSQPWLTFVHPEDRQATITIVARLAANEPVYSFENRYQCRDGSYRWISWRSYPLAQEGLIFAVARDVTERTQAEEAIRSREAKLRSIFRAAPIGIGMSVNQVIMEVNDQLCSLSGYTREELLGQSARMFYASDDDYEAARHQLYGQVRESGLSALETRWRRQDGGIIEVLLSSSLLAPDDPDSGVTFTVLDITGRKAAEETLRLSEFKYRELFNNIRSAVAIYQVVSEGEDFVFLEINRALERIERVKREDIVGRNLSEVFPGVKDFGLFEVLQRVWRTGIPELFPVAWYQDQHISGWRHNYVYQLPSGEVVAVYDDVTEKKQAEETQRRSYELIERITETSPVGITVLDRAGKITSANARAEEVLGLSRECITARTYNDPQWRITDYDGKPINQEHLPFRQVMDTDRPVFAVRHAIEHPEGRRVLLAVNAAPLWDQEGQIEGVVATVEDVTERVNAERDLREARQEWEEIFQAIGHPTIILDSQHNIMMANRATVMAAGASAAELHGKKCYEIFHGSDHPPKGCPLEKMLISACLETVEMEIEALGGVFLVSCTPVVDEAGRLQKVIHIATNITERQQAEEALKQSAATLKGIFKAAPIGIGLVKNRRIIWTNEQVSDITGYSADELQGQSARDLYESDEEFARVGQVKYEEIRKSGTGSIETRFRCKDGSVRDILLSSTPLDPAHPTGEMIFTAMDITERRRAREELYREKEKYRVFTEESPLGVAIIDHGGRYRYVNPKFMEIFGYTLADIPTGKDWFAKAFPDSLCRRQVMSLWMDDLREAKVGESRPRTFPVICKNGQEKIIHFRPVTLGTKDQLIIYEDITEQTRGEETLKSLIANAPMGIYIIQGGKFVLVNPGFEAITGYRGQELLGKDYITLVTPEYQAIVRKKAIRVLKKADTSPYEYQFTSKSGEAGWVMETVISTQYKGKRAVLGYFMDITAHKKLEIQFLQAQRMEAVGRLAGGLAHDFNNVLAIIVIYVETVLKEIHQGDPLYLKAKGIKEAALRAISLTRQLMAVGRRQVLQPRAIKLNALVSDMEAMLRRLIGEDVELVLKLDPVDSVAKVDPSQLEQILLNLVVNARDAMPQGGILTLATTHTFLDKSSFFQHADAAPGPYVVLAVSDTGIGMDQETQTHILEPFYTTKPSSEGTGLGLSTVYGIVKQSGGFLEVDSEPDKGATFKIFLPAAKELLEPSAKITESPLLEGTETILLVEDVDDLRQLVHDVLKDCGYTVLTASHGKEALLIGERHQGPIHLLLLDVVLPQMSGGEVAERLKSWYPGTKVLYMSGYPEDAIIHHKVLDGAAGFIQKPFSPINLASKVREVLDSSPQISR